MTRAARKTKARARSHGIVLRACALALLAGALGGCYATTSQVASPGQVPNDYRLRHPIVIQEGDRTVELLIGRNRGGLTPSQRAEVLTFARGWKKEATGGLVIEVPAGTPNERAAADTLPEIQALLIGATGLPPHGVTVQPYAPGDPVKLATIRIKYPRMAAEAGPCGLWPDDLGPSYANTDYLPNKPYWNLGCSNQRNLAAMVEEPADLVQPRGETPAYTGRRTVVLDKYRKGEPTATMVDKEDKGKISDVGK